MPEADWLAERPGGDAGGQDPGLAAVLGALREQARGLVLECVDCVGRDRALTGNDLQRRIGGVVARLERHRISSADAVELATTFAPAALAAALAVLTVGAELRFGAPAGMALSASRPVTLRLVDEVTPDTASDHRNTAILSELADVELEPLLGLDRPSHKGRLRDGGDVFTLDRLFHKAWELTNRVGIQRSSVVAFGFAPTGSFLPLSLAFGALIGGTRLLMFDNAFALRHPQRWYQMLEKSEATHVLGSPDLSQIPARVTAITVRSPRCS